MFHYYDYLYITSTAPSSELIHLTNKELEVYGKHFISSQGLSCILFGDNIKKMITQAIYVSPTHMKCPLTHLVYENTVVTLHITNDINYFMQVNKTQSGVVF